MGSQKDINLNESMAARLKAGSTPNSWKIITMVASVAPIPAGASVIQPARRDIK